MKLSEIEAVGYTHELRDFIYGSIDEKLYTADQMQEYAKAKVFEALKKYGVQAEEWSDHEAELAYKQMTKFIFEEDTKND